MTKPKILKRESWLDEAAEIARSAGIIALPFERLFGLAADAWSEEALEKIQTIKNRFESQRDKPISVILPNRELLGEVAEPLNRTAEDLANQHWPGPLTLLVKARQSVPTALVGPGGLVGVRVPGPCPAFELAKKTDLVLTATSANLSGKPDSLTHGDVVTLEGVDAVVEGEVMGPPGSTIVDCSGKVVKVMRQGCVRL